MILISIFQAVNERVKRLTFSHVIDRKHAVAELGKILRNWETEWVCSSFWSLLPALLTWSLGTNSCITSALNLYQVVRNLSGLHDRIPPRGSLVSYEKWGNDMPFSSVILTERFDRSASDRYCEYWSAKCLQGVSLFYSHRNQTCWAWG